LKETLRQNLEEFNFKYNSSVNKAISNPLDDFAIQNYIQTMVVDMGKRAKDENSKKFGEKIKEIFEKSKLLMKSKTEIKQIDGEIQFVLNNSNEDTMAKSKLRKIINKMNSGQFYIDVEAYNVWIKEVLSYKFLIDEKFENL
jgi:hypothetical protein